MRLSQTLSAYTNSLVAKRAVLAFINNYFILFYIACVNLGNHERESALI